jgi:NAD(P)-dependent dehydrogenase (short-subunit alcohol dehydrogenase family)
MQSVVVTGTSTGIGWGTAKVLLDRGFRVFGSVRKQADADRLQQEFGANFTPLLFDVTEEAAVHAAARQVRRALNGETLAGLVNNAGIAVAGPALEMPVADFRRQMEVNVTGPFMVTQAFGPLLGADPSLRGKPGRIVMISSVAGKTGNPLLSPYSTSKHAIEGLSESLRREFMMFGIDVIIIGPGAVKTPIWGKGGESEPDQYDTSPLAAPLQRVREVMKELDAGGLPAEAIGKLVHHALTAPRPRVRYAISPQPFQLFMTSILPKRVVDRIVARRLGLSPLR